MRKKIALFLMISATSCFAQSDEDMSFFVENYFPSLPRSVLSGHKENVRKGVDERWQKVLDLKKDFAPFSHKSDQELINEMKAIHQFRLNLWYESGSLNPRISTLDYMVSQAHLIHGLFRHTNLMAFDYNKVDESYNASTVLIGDRHFVAMMEPRDELARLFWQFFINQRIFMLVRVKREDEKDFSYPYWKDHMFVEDGLTKLDIDYRHYHSYKTMPYAIHYAFTNEWTDNHGIALDELSRLVDDVRERDQLYNHEHMPIAVHCAAGVGRTGTFIAAVAIADHIDRYGLDNLSIEEIVLKLSIQRRSAVATPAQYIALYRFAQHYMDRKNKS